MTAAFQLEELKRHYLCEERVLNLEVCIGRGGFAFTWRHLGDRTWSNFVDGHFVLVSASDGKIWFQSPSEEQPVGDALRDYFRLDEDLDELYRDWCERDTIFRAIHRVSGVRVLRIDPWECLLSFICSQNNAIPRIMNMVATLKRLFGKKVCYEIGGEQLCDYTMPSPSDLRAEKRLEEVLAESKFGYRAKFIASAAARIEDELHILAWRGLDYSEAVERLMEIPGVGPKVADCVALYSLDQLSAVPIDTHVLKIALAHYTKGIASTSMTPKMYRTISGRLRAALGPKAGWAQAVLFTGRLASFK
jgi:N-glycosylase/DNA lyase